jgi:membrane-associated phospholipid phosphatase
MSVLSVTFIILGFVFAWDALGKDHITQKYSVHNLAEKDFSYFARDIFNDLKHFYSKQTLLLWSTGLSQSLLMSYSPTDIAVGEAFQESIQGPRSDKVAELVKPLGKWERTWPIFLAASVFDYIPWKKQPPVLRTVGHWGSRSSRALALGWPPVALFQLAIGSPRPNTGISKWQPFKNESGVSGHAFVGAVPFLAAGSMAENIWLKSVFIVASTATGVSRINDNKHYTSQVVLGWLAAYLSVRAVSLTEKSYNTRNDLSFMVYGNGIRVAYCF